MTNSQSLNFREVIDSLSKLIPALKTLPAWWQQNKGKVLSLIWEATEAQILRNSGWVWHRTLRWSPNDLSGAEVGGFVENFYAANWLSTKRELLNGVDAYAVDEIAIETFSEALELHELGHYRSVSRLLFPEIERLTKAALGLSPTAKRETSLPSFRKVALETHFGAELPPKPLAAITLYEILNEHLYEEARSEEALARLQATDIPNRHACIHGAIDYATAKNSLNTIFMTDYILQIVTIFNLSKPDS